MSGPLRLLPGEGDGPPAVPPKPTGRSRCAQSARAARTARSARPAWADDPVDALAERLVEQIAVAVHPGEVAALLESDGLTAEQVERQYGRPDLFTLAEDLFARVPRHYVTPPPGSDLWRADPLRCALRGLVFALPGLAYVLGAPLWQGRGDLRGLVAAALLAWAVNQGLSHRAHLRLACEGPAASARTLRVGAPSCALVCGATGLALCGPTAAGAFAVGQSVYLAAASALLVLGRERVLLLSLLPVSAGAGVTLLRPVPGLVAAVLLLGTVALTAAVAGRSLREQRGGAAGDGARTPSATASDGTRTPSALSSLPYGLFGLAAGVLAALAGLLDPRTVVVLTLSMGFAEWLLFRYRSLAVAALHSSVDLRGFSRRSGHALALCLGGYLGLLACGAVLTGAGLPALFCLGAVMWTALLLQAFAVAWFPAVVTLTAAAALVAARAVELPYLAVQLIATGLAAAVLCAGARVLLARPTAHR
ncbi:hypothetical protein [Streptomyces sp. KLOTTS4A1]|uniref:hypothetical protein n=1 Tax=Streptomyces sp. KLOTTS4A1 TaxID=3390996 RepID=UPI0039F6180A